MGKKIKKAKKIVKTAAKVSNRVTKTSKGMSKGLQTFYADSDESKFNLMNLTSLVPEKKTTKKAKVMPDEDYSQYNNPGLFY